MTATAAGGSPDSLTATAVTKPDVAVKEAIPAGHMMVPRCDTMKFEKCQGGMKITCSCSDKGACSMMQNLCTMLAGGMCSCCMMMNGMMVCCCNLTMGICKCEMTSDGCCITCTSVDPKCCEMIQACCDCLTEMMKAGCTCCLMMNNTPVCVGVDEAALTGRPRYKAVRTLDIPAVGPVFEDASSAPPKTIGPPAPASVEKSMPTSSEGAADADTSCMGSGANKTGTGASSFRQLLPVVIPGYFGRRGRFEAAAASVTAAGAIGATICAWTAVAPIWAGYLVAYFMTALIFTAGVRMYRP